jgi:D-3-phosphoglycerate dehydrogenase / 2-oxoglutarate reductase
MTAARRDPKGIVAVLCRLGDAEHRLRSDPKFVFAHEAPGYDERQVRALVVRSESRVDATLLDRLPGLAAVIRAGSGLDGIDTAELRARGIELFRNPAVSARAVADLAVTALGALTRRIPLAAGALATGSWRKNDAVGEPANTLGVTVWGGGSVGRAVATALGPALRCVRFAHWPSLDPLLPSTDPDTALAHSDVHVLCLPGRPSTEGLFGPQTLDRVRPSKPYILNVGRFETLDMSHAVRLLACGGLRGVFVDPIEPRHLSSLAASTAGMGPLNLLLTPHIGAQRMDVHQELVSWVTDVVDRIWDGLPER